MGQRRAFGPTRPGAAATPLLSGAAAHSSSLPHLGRHRPLRPSRSSRLPFSILIDSAAPAVSRPSPHRRAGPSCQLRLPRRQRRKSSVVTRRLEPPSRPDAGEDKGAGATCPPLRTFATPRCHHIRAREARTPRYFAATAFLCHDCPKYLHCHRLISAINSRPVDSPWPEVLGPFPSSSGHSSSPGAPSSGARRRR